MATQATVSALVDGELGHLVPRETLSPPDGFLADERLPRLADEIIAREDEFRHLRYEGAVGVWWKQQGGSTGGRCNMGKCQKTSGLVAHLSGVTFAIWIAADHCGNLLLSRAQLEALLYHELCHAALDENGKPMIVGHEFAGFVQEIERHGLWNDDLTAAGQVFVQASLPLER